MAPSSRAKVLCLSATYPSFHSKSAGKLVLCMYPGPFLSPLCAYLIMSQYEGPFYILLYGSWVWGSGRNECVFPDPFYENQNVFHPSVLLNPSWHPVSQQPVLEVKCQWEKWRNGSQNKAANIQCCKITSELTKNCLNQRLLVCATIRWKQNTPQD